MDTRLKNILWEGEEVRWSGRPKPFSLFDHDSKNSILLTWIVSALVQMCIRDRIAPETAFFRPSPGQTQHQQGQTEGEQHVLMEGIDHIPPVQQIKGDFGDQGKQKDPPKISFEMRCG